MSLPTGTVTFLFTDIEGSTQRWEAHRDDMDDAVKRHDAVMRTTIAQHNGYVFKTVGDAFCAVFGRVVDAVMAAIDAQRALTKEDFSGVGGLRVRMALHVGQTSERDGDYFGPTVNRVARLMSIGHGGQVLLSDAAYDLVRPQLPGDISFSDLGLRRLKDLIQPEQVWQLFAGGLTATFPPLNSLDARPNNLPIQATPLIGREQDLDDVKELLGKHRLVTLSGSGGVGKTRLALQVGADLLDHYPDGVWFADFAPITDPELVASVLAKVLGITQVEGHRVDESIPPWLKRKKLLLILDNCEHVLETVALIADALLEIAPAVTMLTTSRQALGISGEIVHRVPSLAVPDNAVGLRAPDALQYGAIALFVDRARAADTRFSVSDDTAPIISDICRRLDGIPLAIELAAARVKVLSIPNLAQRLSDRFKILTGGSRSALPRQKTLTALIDWSYDLLSTQEQTLFTRAAIFAGGFSLDAATAVCTGEGLDEIDILDLLSSLTDKSLVVAETGKKQERYRMLESTRAYALDKLMAAGERERLARRHGEYFRSEAQQADKRYGTGSTLAWFADVELELDNYRAALEWGLSQGNDPVVGAAIAGALEQLWSRGGLAVEGRYWIEPLLERMNVTENPQIAARLWYALTVLYSGKRMCEAAEYAASLYESADDCHGAALARGRLAWGLLQMGRIHEASETSMRALATLSEYEDKEGVANCLSLQGSIAIIRGETAEGRDLHTQALAVYKSLGDELGAAIVLGNLAELEFADGRPEEALRSVSEALEMDSRRGVDTLNMAMYRSNGTAYSIALGEIDGARTLAREALSFARQAQAAMQIAIALQHSALLMALFGQQQGAARLLGYVNAQLKELRVTREPTELWSFQKLMTSLREHLSDAEIEKLAAEGAVWAEDQAVEEGLKV